MQLPLQPLAPAAIIDQVKQIEKPHDQHQHQSEADRSGEDRGFALGEAVRMLGPNSSRPARVINPTLGLLFSVIAGDAETESVELWPLVLRLAQTRPDPETNRKVTYRLLDWAVRDLLNQLFDGWWVIGSSPRSPNQIESVLDRSSALEAYSAVRDLIAHFNISASLDSKSVEALNLIARATYYATRNTDSVNQAAGAGVDSTNPLAVSIAAINSIDSIGQAIDVIRSAKLVDHKQLNSQLLVILEEILPAEKQKLPSLLFPFQSIPTTFVAGS